MQLRPAPGKEVPICQGGCINGICEEVCHYGRCVKKCKCDQGWEGLRCNVDSNDCDRLPVSPFDRPCEHRCVNLEGYRRCLCEEGYDLAADQSSCVRTKSLCELKKCEMDCEEKNGVAFCLCPKPGFILGHDGKTCVDENECLTQGIGICRSSEVCHNVYGSYRCDCAKGYARPGGSHLCEDIDECKLGLHDCAEDQICQNFPGYFQCIFNEEDSDAEKPELVPYNFDEGRTNLRHAVPIAEERDELVGQSSYEDYVESDYDASYVYNQK
ncbi:Oidioi.mRNA.OKI2018_I69.PAR.g8920.t1.cds [Oikopleura dioica]|uniref:Oidioi.mRNA.OKI2018_I69.PAR.g8920.t1.cds n=1 Tax=Oikopleura dioica TaxID=34765 RepID=A0ABN7RP52_OIKDI|nr:Oidioi.mRNA.OKI2018_I69.PAR.g8920.t1.cds [Oikopleura dioica]